MIVKNLSLLLNSGKFYFFYTHKLTLAASVFLLMLSDAVYSTNAQGFVHLNNIYPS